MKKICSNCDDFNNNTCSIRYTILKDGTKIPMKRTPNQKGCKVFMYKIKG